MLFRSNSLCIPPGNSKVLFLGESTYPGRIFKLTLEGKVLGVIGKSGRNLGQFSGAHQLACPSENEIYVAEILNWQYLAAYALVTLVVVFGGLFWTRRVQGKPLALSSIVTMGMACANSGFVGYPVMMLTLGDGVDMFVLDPSIGAFVRVAERIRMPARNKVYSLNEGNRLSLPAGYQRYLQWAQSNGYSSRYVGAMVGDVHRVLLQGGVFMYPPTQKAPKGKLRLMYEANPMAMLVEQAGGKALAAPGQRILDVQPEGIHQRTCVVLGSPEEVDQVMAQVKGEVASSEG